MTTTAQITKKSKTPSKATSKKIAAPDAPETEIKNSQISSPINAENSAMEVISDFTKRIVEKQIEIALIDRSETVAESVSLEFPVKPNGEQPENVRVI